VEKELRRVILHKKRLRSIKRRYDIDEHEFEFSGEQQGCEWAFCGNVEAS